MANVVVSAIATFNGKALTKGKKQLTDFEKTTQKLGKTFTKVFAGVAFVAFAKNAVNAFVESEKAAAKLRTTVKNLGLEFEQPGIDKYLQGLSLQFGIIDENLIPGFQRLLIATKDVSTAQSLFETALNVSAGTGKDLNAVTTSLSKAYMGDSVALGRLGVGLSKAQLKSASFLDIQRTLNVNFAGQAAAAVEGYAGDMAKLTVAVDESKEAIGKGLLDALKALSGDTSIDTFTTKMVRSAEIIGNAFSSVIDFLSLLNPNAAVKVDGKFVRKSDTFNSTPFGQAGSLENKVIKQSVTLRKTENAQIKAKNELEKLKDKYDLERIGLQAALNAATDDETKLRLAEKLAILDGNAARAQEYLADRALLDISNLELLARLEQINALKELTKGALQAAFAMGAVQRGEYTNISNVPSNGGGGGGGGFPMPSMAIAMGGVQRGEYATPAVTVNVAGSLLTDDDLTDTIQRTILQINKQGRGTTPAGGLSGGT